MSRRHIVALTLRSGLVAIALPLVGSLVGCNANSGEHGKYTQERVAVATQRMQEMKSGTEWQMAQQQYLAGDIDKALKTIDRSLTLNPRVAKSHVLRGRIMLEKGRLEDARQSLANAEELQPDNVEANYFLGIVHERFRLYDDALARYMKCIQLDANNPQYVTAAAEMYMQTSRLDQAEQLLNERRKNFEYNAAVRQTLGQIQLLRGSPEKASAFFEEASLLAPDDLRIREDLVQAQMSCQKFADAEVNIAKLLDDEKNKSRRDLKQMQARCLVAIDRPVEARTILLELTADREGGRDLRSWVDLGNVAGVLKDRVHMRLAATRAVAIAPDRPEGYTLRAMFAKFDNRPDDALQAFDQAAERAKGDASPLVLKAMLLKDLNRLSEAREALQQAMKTDPKNPNPSALLASLDQANTTGGSTIVSHPDAAR